MSTLTLKELSAPTGEVIKIASGKTLDLNSQGTLILPTIPHAKMPSGSVLQVKHAILTAPMTSTTAATWIDVTNLSISITPKSTSSKFHVSFNLNAMIVSNDQRGGVRLVRDSTAIGVATSTGSRTAASVSFAGVTDGIYRLKNMSGSALDSPSTTSAVTYKVQFQCENTTEVKINHDDNDSNGSTFFRATSEITVMEIAG